MVSPLRKLLNLKVLAERVGFEPTIPVKVYTLSKRAPSATRPSLRMPSLFYWKPKEFEARH